MFHDLWTLLQEVIPRSLWSKTLIYTCVRFWTVTELWAFFNSRTRPRVNRDLRNQLAGDVLSTVAYPLRCKHYFCHLTRPSSYRESSFRISTLGRYLRNAGKVAWPGIRLASVHCMTQLLLRVQKPLSPTLQRFAGSWFSEQHGDSFIKAWAVERQCVVPVSPLRNLISVLLLRSPCHLHFRSQSMQVWFMCTVFVTVIRLMP